MSQHEPVRVLAVEGDYPYLLYLKDLLSAEKSLDLFDLYCAENDAAAMQHLEKSKIDLLLIDISHPANSGLAPFGRIHQRFPDIPKLVLIEVNDEPLALEAIQKGAKGHLFKIKSNRSPLPQTLLQIVRARQQEAAIRKNEEFFRNLIENASDVITVLDAQGLILYQSPSLERVFGYKPEDLLGHNAFEFVHSEDLSIVKALFEESVKNRSEVSPKARFRFRHRDGSWLYLEAIGRIITDDKGQIRSVINSRDVTEQVRLESELRQLSLVDPLTGLYNRRSFMIIVDQQLKKAERSKKRNMHLVFIDMDGLKTINDRFGHSEGDTAIREISTLLRQTFRSMDVLARIGGDEFLVFLQDTPEESIPTVIKHLRENIDVWNRRNAKPYPLTVSMGVVVYDPENPCDVETLIKKADDLMYQEKKSKSHRSAP